VENRTFVLRKFVCLASLILSFAFSGTLFGQTPVLHNGRPAVGEEILIRLRSNAPAALERVRRAAPFASIEDLSPGLSVHLVRAPGRSLNALLQAFSNQSDVLYAEPNYILQATTTTPNDVSYGLLWGMTKISTPSAWDITTGGTSTVLGVVDTGIDYTHPDLAGNVWSAPSSFTVTIQGRTVTCPAGSHGFNALNNSCDPRDDNGHGTHTSGTIAATGNNAVGVAGVNWNARIMGLKFMNASGSGPVSAAVNALEFAIQVKALFAGTTTPVDVRVLSNSWGSDSYSQTLLDAINKTNANEMLFVAAAGNLGANTDNLPFYPASFSTVAPNIIAVAATNIGDGLAGFSNYGPNSVQLGAPGTGIYSTYQGGGYATLDGTSTAAPHVAGAALLMLASCPEYTTAALKNSLLANVDAVPSLSGKTTTGGRLNVDRAVRSCRTTSNLTASFLGTTGEDYVGPLGSAVANGNPDWHVELQGLRGTPTKVRVSTAAGGVWEGPFNGINWIIKTQYVGNTAHLWFEPWSSPTGLHVKVWYSDSTTDETDATASTGNPPPPVPSTLLASFLGSTGQDYVGPMGSTVSNGVPDWHVQLQGLRGTPTKVQITKSEGVWETPFNGVNWVIATQYGGNGTGDLWFEPYSTPTNIHVKVWYADSSTDEADAGSPAPPSGSFSSSFLGTTGQDYVGPMGSTMANGIPDWHIRLNGLRGTPTKVRISTAAGVWETPFNGVNWVIATQYGGDGTGDLWFEPYSTPTSIHVTVWYSDSTTDEANASSEVARVAETVTETPEITAVAFYVDNSGSPACGNFSGWGTEANPWCTINYGINNMSAGGTLYVKAGTYREDVYISRPAGTASQPTVIRTYPGHVVTILGGGVHTGRVKITGTSYVTFDGFVITNFNQGLFIESADHIVVQNTTIHLVGQEGMHVLANSSFITLQNNVIHDTRQYAWNGEGIYIGTSSSGPLDNTNNVIVRNNLIYNTPDEGIELKPGTHDCIVEGNTLYNIMANGEYSETGGAIEVNEATISCPSCVNGIQTWPFNPNHIIRNNVVHSSKTAIRLGTGGTVYNNVVYNIVSPYNGILVNNNAGDFYPRRVYHNTVDMTSSRAILVSGGSADVRNNIGPATANNMATSSIFFVNPAARDYHLLPGSAPVNAGVDLTATVPTDIEGKTRSIPDLGAYEASSSGVPTNQAPVVNAGVNQSVVWPASVNLSGTVSDDGMPVGGSLTSTWSKASGPGTVTFGNPGALATTATFSVAGTYALQLTATDGVLSSSATMIVAVMSGGDKPNTLLASFLGTTGQDYVGQMGATTGNGVADWHIQLQGLRGTPIKVQITTLPTGVWETPFNGVNWIIATQFSGNDTGDLWFEPYSAPNSIHVKVWYSDLSTDETDAIVTSPQPPSTLSAFFLGTTGQDYVGPMGSIGGNGIPDWHLQLQGLRGTPTTVRITTIQGGVWETPFNGVNWVIAAQYGGGGSGDLWFEPYQTPTSVHVKVWYADSSTDEVDAVVGSPPPAIFSAAFLGTTGQDYVGSMGSIGGNGIPDWHLQLQGLRGTPTKVRITTAEDGEWETPFNGANWIIATQFSGNGTGDLWFEPFLTPSSVYVKVWYADGTTAEADAH
jgi:thermitase